MMSTNDFDLRLKHIEEQYAAKREGAEAYRDQEVARLFEQCEWGQEKIARHMGKKKSWVSYRLTFGRFLSFSTSGGNSDERVKSLTERRFRDHYQAACRAFPGKHQSEEKERNRFEHVVNAIQNGIPQGRAAIGRTPQIRKAVIDCLSDGAWRTTGQVTAEVEKNLLGVTEQQAREAITCLRRRPPAGGLELESKSIGKKSQYRLVKTQPRSRPVIAESLPGGPDPVLALYEEAQPLIEELRHMGRKSRYEQAPGEILKLAVKLERIFESRLTKQTA